ncbi:uncharacterized protein LOC126968622 [Leptidea sinapis]|uniref:uncharacterized protein LOC126968622 n=1 Tax=Leptidea sinapis TaxID=189913 RepID=UPI0021C45F15|nr:uncharacterized protein LOC126968622 [Leptidea sinapis]
MNTDAPSPATPESVIFNEDVDSNHSDPTTSFQFPSIPRRRKNPIELQEAGKTMKDAMTSLNKVLNKPQAVEDDFDRYGKILANKLRKLSESDSIKMMYEIDGLFIKRMNNTPPHFTRPSPTYTVYSEPTQRQQIQHPAESPTYYVRPESSSTSYSDPGVQTSSVAFSDTNTIQIISDEILRSPYPEYNTANDVLGQAFRKA